MLTAPYSRLISFGAPPPPPAPLPPASLSSLIRALPPSHPASSSSSSFSDRPGSSSGVSFTATPTTSSFPTAHFTSSLLSATSSPSMPPASSLDDASSSSSKKRKELEEVGPPDVENNKKAKYPAVCSLISRPDTTDLRFGPEVIPALVTSGSWESITSLPVDQCSVIHTSLPLFYSIWETNRGHEKTHHLFVNFLRSLLTQGNQLNVFKQEVIEWFANHPITLSQRSLFANLPCRVALEFSRQIILINPDLGYKFLIDFLHRDGKVILNQLTQEEVIEILSRADQLNSLPDFFYFAYLVIRRLRLTHSEKASELAVKYINGGNCFYAYDNHDLHCSPVPYRELLKAGRSGIIADEEIEEGLSLIELLTAEDREKITSLTCTGFAFKSSAGTEITIHKLIRKFPNIKKLNFMEATNWNIRDRGGIELPPNCENLHSLYIHETSIKFLEKMPHLTDLEVNNRFIITEESIKFLPRSCMPRLDKLTINGKRIPVSAIPEGPSLYDLGKESFSIISSALSSSSSSSTPP